MGVLAVLVLLVFIFVLVILASSIKIVPQAYAYVVERLGAYQSTWSLAFISRFLYLIRWPARSI